jgi:hypothetical protein
VNGYTSRKKLLEDLADDRQGNARDKYRRLALLMDKVPDLGTEAWNDVRLLIKFRNEFMHFRPAWEEDSVHEGKFVTELRKKIPVVAAFQRKFMFPYGFMTYGCAKWAIRTVLTFSSEYGRLLAVEDRFALRWTNFDLP